MDMFKVAVIGVGAVLLALQFKQTKPEYGTYISLAVGVVILGLVASQLRVVTDSIQKIAALIAIDQKYIVILLKVIGISYLCEFASNLCRDSGYASVASQIEMAGKLGILVMSLPIIMSLLDTIQVFLK